jgi:hypothetical protein
VLEALFVTEAVERMDNGAFGRFSWTDELLPVRSGLRERIAVRLFDMGFSERALQITTPSYSQATSDQIDSANFDTGPKVEPMVLEDDMLAPVGLQTLGDSAGIPEDMSDTITLQESRNLISQSVSRRQELANQLLALTTPESR